MDPLTFIAVIVLVGALLLDRHLSRKERERLVDTHGEQTMALMEQTSAERRELANRIQRPEILPTAAASRPPLSAEQRRPRDIEAMRQIGTTRPIRDTPIEEEPAA